MSIHAYEPQVNGTSFHVKKHGKMVIANVRPTNNPMTGQFVPMNRTDEDPFWEDDFGCAGGPVDLVHRQQPEDHDFYEVDGEPTEEEMALASIADAELYTSLSDDKYSDLDWEHGGDDVHFNYSKYGMSEDGLPLEEVLRYDAPVGANCLVHSFNGKVISEEVAENLLYDLIFGDYNIPKAIDTADEAGDMYEHLPHRAGSHASFKADPSEYWYWDINEKRDNKKYHPGCKVHTSDGMSERSKGWYSNDSHGKHGRYSAKKEEVRRHRHATHRQMNGAWETWMTDGAALEHSIEIYVGGDDSWSFTDYWPIAVGYDHSDHRWSKGKNLMILNGIDQDFIAQNWTDEGMTTLESCDWDSYYDDLMRIEEDRFWTLENAYHRGEFGYYDHKGPLYVEFYIGMEDDLRAAEENPSIAHTGIFSSTWDGMDDYVERMGGYRPGFYAWEIQAEMERDQEEARYYQELADMGPTQEEWEAMEAEERAAEEAAEKAAEAEDELYAHVPMCNAMGRKAQIAQRVLINA